MKDHTTLAGFFSHTREACLSRVEELPSEGDKERLWADTQKETCAFGSDLPGQIDDHQFVDH